ncbi:unnamed protein product [Lymnaea stagnalis]|uniref:Uncharacterized protein n=1 Tax=Lymnaea stagnalis TaxID=6523 RepID=A0AAV2H9Z1_LYMST
MERQKYTFPLWVVLCVFGVANNSNGDIQCSHDSPIKCPVTDACCQFDQFCHTGICADCPLKKVPRDELLIKCRKMTIKDMNISSEIQLSCMHMCHVHFTPEEINKYLENQIYVLVQNHTELLTLFKLESTKSIETIKTLNDEINDLKQRWNEMSQILNQTNLKYHQADSDGRLHNAKYRPIAITALVMALAITFFILLSVSYGVIKWKKRKIPQRGKDVKKDQRSLLSSFVKKEEMTEKINLALEPLISSIQNLETNNRNEVFEALRLDIDENKKENVQMKNFVEKEIESRKRETQGVKKLVDTTLNHCNKVLRYEIMNDMKQQNLKLKDEVDQQAGTITTLNRELMKLKSEVILMSQNFNKTEKSTEGASSGFDSYAVTSEKPKAIIGPLNNNNNPHIGLSLSSEDDQYVHTGLTVTEGKS